MSLAVHQPSLSGEVITPSGSYMHGVGPGWITWVYDYNLYGIPQNYSSSDLYFAQQYGVPANIPASSDLEQMPSIIVTPKIPVSDVQTNTGVHASNTGLLLGVGVALAYFMGVFK